MQFKLLIAFSLWSVGTPTTALPWRGVFIRQQQFGIVLCVTVFFLISSYIKLTKPVYPAFIEGQDNGPINSNCRKPFTHGVSG
jgi:hypothetical protein